MCTSSVSTGPYLDPFECGGLEVGILGRKGVRFWFSGGGHFSKNYQGSVLGCSGEKFEIWKMLSNFGLANFLRLTS